MKTSKKVLSVLLAVLLLALTMAVAAVPAQAYDTIQFGNYPQTKVTETDALKNAANNATWKSYDYYIGNGSYNGEMAASDYMKYADFFSGGVKYRAVKFTKYRPYSTHYISNASNSSQDNNGYSLNTTYYFKYEPLTWRVLDASTGLILCDSIIDSQAFQNVVWKNGNEFYIAVNSTYYANNSTKSSISHWLNNDFYETAFSASQKNNIKTTTVTYTAYSSDYSQYNSVMADRKMFLLSYDEAQSSSYGLSSTSARTANGTDYAKCQGLEVNSHTRLSNWRLRSAGSNSYSACCVCYDGDLGDGSYVNFTNSGIRPACKLSNLTSDISQSDIYTVSTSVSPAAGGTATGGGSYGRGETVTLTATPNSGYTFSGWYDTSNYVDRLLSSEASYSFHISKNMTLQARFTKNTVTVNASAATGGSLEGRSGVTITVAPGEFIELIATPDEGYTFDGWYSGDTLVCDTPVYDLNPEENMTLQALFKETQPSDPGITPTDPLPTEPENVCPWCGGQHNGFFQGIIGFFHNILAKIFGNKY